MVQVRDMLVLEGCMGLVLVGRKGLGAVVEVHREQGQGLHMAQGRGQLQECRGQGQAHRGRQQPQSG